MIAGQVPSDTSLCGDASAPRALDAPHPWRKGLRPDLCLPLFHQPRRLLGTTLLGLTLATSGCGGGKQPGADPSSTSAESNKKALSATAEAATYDSAENYLEIARDSPYQVFVLNGATSPQMVIRFTIGLKNKKDVGFNDIKVAAIIDTPVSVPLGNLFMTVPAIAPYGELKGIRAELRIDRAWYEAQTKPVDFDPLIRWKLGASPATTLAQRTLNLETTGVLPKLDRSDSLAGPDANSNGVRDDIEAILKSRFQDPKQLAAAMQSARVFQLAILVAPGDKTRALEVAELDSRATNCLGDRFPVLGSNYFAKIGSEIESMTTNTPNRLRSFLAFDHLLSGSAFRLPKGDTCDE